MLGNTISVTSASGDYTQLSENTYLSDGSFSYGVGSHTQELAFGVLRSANQYQPGALIAGPTTNLDTIASAQLDICADGTCEVTFAASSDLAPSNPGGSSTPEPASIALFGGGLGVLALLRSRRTC
jgi:hypothetical protein